MGFFPYPLNQPISQIDFNLIHQSRTIFYFPLFGVAFNALIFQTQLPLQIIQFSFP
jgi:hypothetical protein